MTQNKTKILFIAGHGRSGSTLLDRILGQSKGIVSVGELEKIWSHGLEKNNLCSCEIAFDKCEFWNSVLHEAFGQNFKLDFKEILRLQQTIRMRRIPQLSAKVFRSNSFQANLHKYSEIWTQLLNGIKVVSGANVIVDSSKNPTILYALRDFTKLHYSVIHLVRDSRAVAFSLQRLKHLPDSPGEKAYVPRHSILSTSITWNWWNLLTEGARLLGMPIRLIKYEDLMQNSRQVIADILDDIGESQLAIDWHQEKSMEFKTIHSIAGNPIRFQTGKVNLTPDLEWRKKMSKHKKQTVTALTLPFLYRYGYLKR